MQKVLVHCESRYDADQTRRILESHLPYQVFTSFSEEGLEAQLAKTNFNLLICQKRSFGKEDYDQLAELREMGFTFPILVVGKQVKIPNEYWENPEINMNYLMAPYSDRALVGIARKLLLAKKIPQQRFKRFPTNQPAEVETFFEGASHTSNMYNLSKGGAYCEFDDNPQLGVGDMLRLKVRLDDLSSERVMNAKVVWLTRKGKLTGRQGVGVKFISQNDAYRLLMEKI